MSGDFSGGGTWTKSTIRLSHHVILVPHLGSVSSQTNCNLIAKVTNALAAPISLHWLKFYSALFLLLHNLRNLLNLFTISRHTCRFPQRWENSPCPNPIESSHNKSNIRVQYIHFSIPNLTFLLLFWLITFKLLQQSHNTVRVRLRPTKYNNPKFCKNPPTKPLICERSRSFNSNIKIYW